jgi:transcriptional antiterminator
MSKDILKTLEDHLKWLETPEGKQSLVDYFKEMEDKKENLINYVGSEEFNKTYQIIYDWVKVKGRLDDTDIHYKFNPGIDIETEDWNKFTDSISKKYEGSEIVDTEASFPKCHFEYGALDIHFMHGQGTVCWIDYNQENDREIKLNKIL